MPAANLITSAADLQHLLAFNQQVLDQALALVALHAELGGPCYAGPVGSHLRHVIEHYDALLFPAQTGEVDYDSRARNRELETQPTLAARRLQALAQCLQDLPGAWLNGSVRVRGVAGTAGEFAFAAPSSLARELAFVASHAVHHFALLKTHCQALGIPTPADFGKAPATVAHERAQDKAPAETAHTLKEPPCLTLLLQA
jgi:hypothetical protein